MPSGLCVRSIKSNRLVEEKNRFYLDKVYGVNPVCVDAASEQVVCGSLSTFLRLF